MHLENKIILYLEDDASLANLVKLTFDSFGFKGKIIQASKVEEALNVLTERKQKKAPVDLIITDMHLPDGDGLDLLQYIKSNAIWSKTPVVVLSGEREPDTVTEAYALGANCYLSKIPRKGRGLEHLRSLYQFWIESVELPESSFTEGVDEILSNAIRLRTQTAQFYVKLSKKLNTSPIQESFWLDRAMVEGNLSSLLIFFQGMIDAHDVPKEFIERLTKMQTKVELALIKANQMCLRRSIVREPEILESVLSLVEAFDEEVFADSFGITFPVNKTATQAMKFRASKQLEEIANYILKESKNPELLSRANSILNFAHSLKNNSF